MIAKKYIAACVMLLTLLGFYKEQTPAQNQEIELQFTRVVQTVQSEELIQAIKEKLQSLGVDNITVRQQNDETLKIAYHSAQAVATIKAMLLDEGFKSTFPLQELPANDRKQTLLLNDLAAADGYKIDVYELQNSADVYFGMQGKFVLSLHKEYDKSPNPNTFAVHNNYFSSVTKLPVSAKYSVTTYKNMVTTTASYETPDVRAGPFFYTL